MIIYNVEQIIFWMFRQTRCRKDLTPQIVGTGLGILCTTPKLLGSNLQLRLIFPVFGPLPMVSETKSSEVLTCYPLFSDYLSLITRSNFMFLVFVLWMILCLQSTMVSGSYLGCDEMVN